MHVHNSCSMIMNEKEIRKVSYIVGAINILKFCIKKYYLCKRIYFKLDKNYIKKSKLFMIINIFI